MELILQPFKIEFNYSNKTYKAEVIQEIKTSVEIFTITHAGKSIQVQSDRPLIAQIANSKKKPNFKAINAKVNQQAFYEIVVIAIKDHIYQLEHPPFDWSEHPKNMNNR